MGDLEFSNLEPVYLWVICVYLWVRMGDEDEKKVRLLY